jgi:hypothetical protein
MLIDHIDHIAKVAGIDHVGLGSDFDGVFGQLPEGMDSPADFPKIAAALMERGYSAEDCGKIRGGNVMRVFREVEAVSRELRVDEGIGNSCQFSVGWLWTVLKSSEKQARSVTNCSWAGTKTGRVPDSALYTGFFSQSLSRRQMR